MLGCIYHRIFVAAGVLAIAACAQAIPPSSPSPVPSALPAAPASASSTPLPTVAVPSPAATATGAPFSPPPSIRLDDETLFGSITLPDGTPVQDARVRARSINPDDRFDSSVDVLNGRYVINGLWVGLAIEVTVTSTGLVTATRTLTITVHSDHSANEADFVMEREPASPTPAPSSTPSP